MIKLESKRGVRWLSGQEARERIDSSQDQSMIGRANIVPFTLAVNDFNCRWNNATLDQQSYRGVDREGEKRFIDRLE